MFGDVGGSCVDEDKPHVVINENLQYIKTGF